MPISPPIHSEGTAANVVYDGANPETSPHLLVENMSLSVVQNALQRAEALDPDNAYDGGEFSLIRGSCLLELALHPLTPERDAQVALQRSEEALEYAAREAVRDMDWLEARRLLADWPIVQARLANGTGGNGEAIPTEARNSVSQNLLELHEDAKDEAGAQTASFLRAIIVVRELLDREDIVTFASTSREIRGRGKGVLSLGHTHHLYAITDDQKVPLRAGSGNRDRAWQNPRQARLSIAFLVKSAQEQKGLNILSGNASDMSVELMDWIINPEAMSLDQLTLLDAMSSIAVKAVEETSKASQLS